MGELAHLIEGAAEAGVVSTREAEALLHPIRDRQRAWSQKLRRLHLGYDSSQAISDFIEDGHDRKSSLERLRKDVDGENLPASLPLAVYSEDTTDQKASSSANGVKREEPCDLTQDVDCQVDIVPGENDVHNVNVVDDVKADDSVGSASNRSKA